MAWDDLKRRMEAASAKPALPAFVELVTPPAPSLPECMIELEGRRGKLRIQLKNRELGCWGSMDRKTGLSQRYLCRKPVSRYRERKPKAEMPFPRNVVFV